MHNPTPPWLVKADDGIWELYLDHTLLSSARMCESSFILSYVQNYRPKGLMPWPLKFGILMHHCMEWFYKKEMELGNTTADLSIDPIVEAGTFPTREWLEYGANLWRELGLASYSQFPQFKAIGGMAGFILTLGQYAEYYHRLGNDLRPIALEIAFGRNKEVPLLVNHLEYKYAPFRLYLAGRIDYLFDDGRRIGAMDHKTFSMAGKNPMSTYEVQEGMTGYIYAMQYIYEKLKMQMHSIKDKQALDFERDTNVLWLNFILTKGETDLTKKFMRVPLYKTPYQLEEFRQRQIATAAKIFQMVVEGRPPDFNTSVCTNFWHSTCQFQPVHRLPSKGDMDIILSREFTIEKAWNPEAVDK